jgi:hypothetical protein
MDDEGRRRPGRGVKEEAKLRQRGRVMEEDNGQASRGIIQSG